MISSTSECQQAVAAAGVPGSAFERSDSGKRRRLSECRKVFSRLSGKKASTSSPTSTTTTTTNSTSTNNAKDNQQSQARRLLSTGSSINQSSWSSSAGTADSDTLQPSTTRNSLEQSSSTPSPFNLNQKSGGNTLASRFPPSTGDAKKSFKIQLFIRIAPENEPLIFDHHSLFTATATATAPEPEPTSSTRLQHLVAQSKHQSLESLSNNISSKEQNLIRGDNPASLIRQNSSTKRRQQLLAMHNQTVKKGLESGVKVDQVVGHSEDNLLVASVDADKKAAQGEAENDDSVDWVGFPLERERSSTIAGGCLTDAATSKFLERQKHQQHIEKLIQQHSLLNPPSASPNKRELIYFKRDGQRFGHEFTLKLAVGKSYRCLFKIKPLVPLESITIQGHNVQFVDCSRNEFERSNYYSSLSSSAGNLNNGYNVNSNNYDTNSCCRNKNSTNASSPTASQVRGSWQNISSEGSAPGQLGKRPSKSGQLEPGTMSKNYNHEHSHTHQHHRHNHNHNHHNHNHHHHHAHHHHPHQHHHNHHAKLPHALTISNVSRVGVVAQPNAFLAQRASLATTGHNLNQQLIRHIRDQQQSQLMRYFANSHPGSSAAANAGHLNDQHIYMFDWSAGHFEVNKNKVRTQVETLLEFRDGQTISLPLQIKFYQSESRQHLEWGSELHFIDYDCSINNLGEIQLDRVQYY